MANPSENICPSNVVDIVLFPILLIPLAHFLHSGTCTNGKLSQSNFIGVTLAIMNLMHTMSIVQQIGIICIC